MAVQRIVIPYAPRPQFMPLHNRTQRWACIVAHRRFGKTVGCINELIKQAITCPLPNGRYAYVAPTYGQAKDVAWSYLKQYTAAFPGLQVMESELWVMLPNGSRIRLYGADNYDRIRGVYLDGVILDEYADMDPRAWSEVIRPALSDRKGWAIFIGTPKGRNGFARIWKQAQSDPDWLPLMLKASETGILDETELADARKTMTPEQFDQEYECSFDAAIIGAFYGREMRDADKDKRITGVPYDPMAQVYTAWDLGMRDRTSIWFAQVVGREIHIIDFYEGTGEALSHYAKVVKEKRYAYGGHFIPHDAKARELGTGKTREEVLQELGLDCTVVTNHQVMDGINAVRLALPKCWFDKDKCSAGIDALTVYRSEYDEKLGTLRSQPVHDWSSHAADAFRYLIMGLDANVNSAKAWGSPSTKWVV